MEITILGLGMRKGEVTLEALKLLESVTYILCIEQREQFPYYDEYQDKLISLDYLFDEYPNRDEALDNIGITAFRLFKTLPNMLFALQGNPVLSVAPVQEIIQYAKRENIAFKIIPASSSIERFMVDTAIDISNVGMQVISGKLIDKVSNHLPVLILNPGYSEMVLAEDKMDILERLAKKLETIYGSNEEFLFYSSKEDGAEINFVNIKMLPPFLQDKSLGRYMVVGPIRYFEAYL